jgi:glyceraldehyde dehydrogenase medium subunit
MYPPEFGYFRPSSLNEALDFLEREDARPLAGGQSLIPMLKFRVIAPKYLVDINKLVEISYVRDEGDRVKIGAIVRHSEISKNGIISSKVKLLSEAAKKVADMQVRNMGTIGGNISHADPASDFPAVALALDARIKLSSLSGDRYVSARDFFKGPFTTEAKKGELVTEIEFPVMTGYVSKYIKVVRRSGDFALVSLAFAIKLKDGVVEDIRLAYAGVDSKPYRAYEAEKLLIGSKLTPALVEDVAEKAAKDANPPSDTRGSSWYRKEVMKIITKKALKEVM